MCFTHSVAKTTRSSIHEYFLSHSIRLHAALIAGLVDDLALPLFFSGPIAATTPGFGSGGGSIGATDNIDVALSAWTLGSVG